jgi:IS30 family transposase
MNYTHLTQDERYQIAILSKAGHDRSDIAQVLNRHKSTIGREMKRNRGMAKVTPCSLITAP